MKTNQRLCPELLHLIEKIKQKKEKELGFEISWAKASKILYDRIINAGGIRGID